MSLSLAAGAHLGAYEIAAAIGAGGMGEVYRARDTKLGREVAIKVILEIFAADADRVARFQREAKVLASLNHPHIAALYGMEEAGGQHFLVMELVEGQTLADRLARGPLAVEETIAIAVQMAEALEAAHEKGVVHRDLKPANIKVTPDDQVKVLDFGLAKAVETQTPSAAAANSPTLSMMASQAGIILGTAAYMSPEQAKGFPADHRSDIFSFGSVVFEMLAGRQPFQGETAPEVLASVLVREPEIARLPQNLNPRLVEVVRRCLEKHPKRRWQAIGDVRAELEGIAAAPRTLPTAQSVVRRLPFWRRAAPAIAFGGVMAGVAAAAAWILKPHDPHPAVRFSVRLSEGQQFSQPGRYLLAISPDGKSIAYPAQNRLYLRSLSDFEPRAIPGTETASEMSSPAFSPDGQSIAFYSMEERVLKRVPVSGGTPMTLCSAAPPSGISWSNGYIFAGQGGLPDELTRGVLRVRDRGGRPDMVVTANPGESIDGPRLLPDGDTLMFAVARTGPRRWDQAQIVGQSLKSGRRKVFIDGGSSATYVPSGYIVYAVAGSLFAVQFDLRRLEVRGEAVSVLEGVRRATGNVTGSADFVVSSTGTAAYIPGPQTSAFDHVDLARVDLKGVITPLKLPLGPYQTVRASPDGLRVAFGSDDGKDAFIATYELAGGSAMRRLTLGGSARYPLWYTDNKRVTFQSIREGDSGIFWQQSDGSAAAEQLTKAAPGESHIPLSWSPDGTTLLFDIVRAEETSLWMLNVKERKTVPFAGIRSRLTTKAVFSPDGRWVAYTISNPARTFIQPYPATGAQYQLSAPVAHAPVWSPDGKTLYYIPSPSKLEGVNVTTTPSVAFGHPFPVIRPFLGSAPPNQRKYDMMRDGRFIAIITPNQPDSSGGNVPAPIVNVVVNWFDELKARVPR